MIRPAQRILSGSKKSFGMYEKALALTNDGADLIHLELGRPCHDTPQLIKDATIRALQDGRVHYSDLRGELPLRQALAAKLRDFNGIAAEPDTVLVTNGLTHASYAAFMAVVDPGDEVILLEPYYPQHVGKVELAGGKVVMAPLDAADNFRIRADLIEERITPRTRAIVLINPANPTGRVYSRQELETLAEIRVCQQRRRHDLQRDLAVHRLLDRQVDRRHAAAPKLAQQSVAGNLDHVRVTSAGAPAREARHRIDRSG